MTEIKRPLLVERAIVGLSLALAVSAASAQIDTHKGPMRLEVGFAAGGSTDVQARMLSEKLAGELGLTVIVENRTGAGGQIAADYVRAAAGDGLTVMLANMHTMVMLPLTSKTVRFDPVKDFKPIGLIATFHEGIAVPADSPARDIDQWLALARKDPSRASYGVPAPGSVSQFMGFKLATASKTQLVPAPYRGAAPMMQDLLGNQIAAGILPLADLAAYQQSGKLRVLAVNGASRAAILPDVPTLKELGQTDLEGLEWTALFVPASTPKSIVDQLNAALRKTLASKEVLKRLESLNNDASPSTPEAVTALIVDDLARWGPVVKASGFTSD
jgi:tripartite-type tricarboxylate transporter receptor subunit TctC